MEDDNNSVFNSISPSALAILEVRSFTSIPFAKESFNIILKVNQRQEESNLSRFDFGLKSEEKLPKEIFNRIIHFETRYRSIDKGIRELGYDNILEFSSGYSLRGFEFCKDQNKLYIDTDLQEVIQTKEGLISQITVANGISQPDNLVLKPMNALDEIEFLNTVSIFKNGPILLVNEGLLMYLDREQKVKLCNIIHNVLSKNGGYWITTDIYIRDEEERKNLNRLYNQNDKEFVKKHNIDANKFGSYEEAENFFTQCGFKIFKKIELEIDKLSSFRLLEENFPTAIVPQNSNKTRETWVLKAV